MTHIRFTDEQGRAVAMCGAEMVSDHQAVDPVVAVRRVRAGTICLACLHVLTEVILFRDERLAHHRDYATFPVHSPKG